MIAKTQEYTKGRQTRNNRKRKESRKRKAESVRGDSEVRTHNHQESVTSSLADTVSECTMNEDLKVINLSNFKLEKRHIYLLSRGLSLSPSTGMDHFEVYKVPCLFLRRVYLKLLYSDKSSQNSELASGINFNDTEALDQLVLLLEEGSLSTDDEETNETLNWRRNAFN